MALFDIWPDFGFRENPYSQETLEANDTGDALLAGRDSEVQEIQRRIGSSGAHPSVEGPVGVGKTSLVNVAVYRMTKKCMEARAGQLYLPAVERFQPNSDLAEFEAGLYRVVAQTLIQYSDSFRKVGLNEPNTTALNRWLNSPEYTSWSVGGSAFGFGGQRGHGSGPNTGEGFARAGFPAAVRQVLADCFPKGTGGIVCVLDNLEIVETTGDARSRLDELRDRVFNIPELRWVLCGSRGIVSRARTERLSGIFQSPRIVGPLADESAIDAIRLRISWYGMDGAEAPVTPQGFEFIYRALNMNLRDAMSTAQEFSQWLYDEYVGKDVDLPSAKDRDQLLEVWLAERAEKAFGDARQIQPRHWQFFEDLAARGGRAGSGEFDEFGFASQPQLVSAVTALANVNLVVREVDPEKGSRTVNAVTAAGWLVFFHRSNFAIPRPPQLPRP